jgi:creatinine amidohydrolase/Fe(II)-dependent formamide hydrolase-like protein
LNHFSYRELLEQFTDDRYSVAILPIGCYEQHGPVLPLGTDSVIAEGIARQIVGQLPEWNCQVFPCVHFTPTEPNRDFCGTVHVSYSASRPYFEGIIQAVLRHPFSAVVLINGHGSVDGMLKELCFSAVHRQFEDRQSHHSVRPVLSVNAFEFSASITREFGQAPGRHAEWTEFLLTFHLLGREYYTLERLNRLEKFAAEGQSFHTRQPGVLGIPMQLRSEDGVHGHPLPPGYPDLSLEEASKRLFDLLSSQVVDKIRTELMAFHQRFSPDSRLM